jgi:hypothetical protein
MGKYGKFVLNNSSSYSYKKLPYFPTWLRHAMNYNSIRIAKVQKTIPESIFKLIKTVIIII